MADLTQSATQTFISHQALTHPGKLEGTPYACAGCLSGTIVTRVANVETTANVTGVRVWVMGSFETSGDDAWFILKEFIGGTTAAESEALTDTEPQAEATIAVASTTNLTVGDVIYIQDTGTVADSEWHRIVKVTTNTSIEVDYGLANQKDPSDMIYTEAEIFIFHAPDLGSLKRINTFVVHEAATGSNVHVLSEGVFATDIE